MRVKFGIIKMVKGYLNIFPSLLCYFRIFRYKVSKRGGVTFGKPCNYVYFNVLSSVVVLTLPGWSERSPCLGVYVSSLFFVFLMLTLINMI